MKILISLFVVFHFIHVANAEHFNQQSALDQLLSTLQCENCDLSDTDLSDQILIDANLAGANLSGANLSGTNLRGANLQGAILRDVDLSDTALGGANLRDADLSDTDIDEVLEYIEIMGTQFEGARFKHGIICGSAPEKGGWGCQQP